MSSWILPCIYRLLLITICWFAFSFLRTAAIYGQPISSWAASYQAGLKAFDNKNYPEAEKLLEKTLQEAELSGLAVEHPDIISSLNKLVWLNFRQGRYELAEKLCYRLLEAQGKASGTSHPAFAGVLNKLAQIYTKQGRYRDSAVLWEWVLEIGHKSPDLSSNAIVCTLFNLAKLYDINGKYPQADLFYTQALETSKKAGLKYKEISAYLNSYAQLLRKTNRLQEAEKIEAQAKEP